LAAYCGWNASPSSPRSSNPGISATIRLRRSRNGSGRKVPSGISTRISPAWSTTNSRPEPSPGEVSVTGEVSPSATVRRPTAGDSSV
jgi:hypothetical protein